MKFGSTEEKKTENFQNFRTESMSSMNSEDTLNSSASSNYDQQNTKRHRKSMCEDQTSIDIRGRATNYEEGARYHQIKKSGCCNSLKRIHSASDILSIVHNTVEESDKADTETSCTGGPPAIPDDNILVSPDQYLNLLLKSKHGVKLKRVPALSLPENFFIQPTANDITGFSLSVVSAIQNSDIAALRTLQRDHGQTYQSCCNRFGESVTHMACRRGLSTVVSFLLSEGDVKSIRICDDYGRTPFHDAIWCREPNFEIMDLLIEKDPLLLFVTDKRGFTPFQYAKREDWNLWLHFLRSRYDLLTGNVDHELFHIFS